MREGFLAGAAGQAGNRLEGSGTKLEKEEVEEEKETEAAGGGGGSESKAQVSGRDLTRGTLRPALVMDDPFRANPFPARTLTSKPSTSLGLLEESLCKAIGGMVSDEGASLKEIFLSLFLLNGVPAMLRLPFSPSFGSLLLFLLVLGFLLSLLASLLWSLTTKLRAFPSTPTQTNLVSLFSFDASSLPSSAKRVTERLLRRSNSHVGMGLLSSEMRSLTSTVGA
mmetsp:Transcript_18609/g.33809  ORF Transcript_18609/g.33809 Transcript_18609/m.33809 type:complete len:224 (+) Transcript_18609:429-1100(+)